MDLIYTNRNREDIGVLRDFSLDLAFGSGENDFELTVSRENHVAVAGCFVYIQGTEYGGIIDAVKSDTGAEEVVYSGRTWHGILNAKILEPDAGQAYLKVSGDANAVLATLISRMGLGTLFKAASGTSGIAVNNYQFDRYISGYNGILKMLKTVGAKLHMEHDGTNVVVSAVLVTDYTQDGVSNDQTALTVTQTKNKVNHLICLGTGELADRMVIHLYADAAGNISRTQAFTGLDEYTAVYDYSSVESEEDLVSGGVERFKELLQQDQLDVDFPESDDIYYVGDIVGAADNVTGISIAVPITKKIVKIEGDLVSVSIETTTESVSAQASAGGGSGGGGSGATFTPHVDSSGNLSWSNDRGLANPETVNIKGDKGDPGTPGTPGTPGAPGAKGDPGSAATIKVGTVTTGEAGSKAAVTNSGTTSAAVFNFTIPKGDKGDPGTPGTPGTPGADGVGISSVEQTTTSTVSGGTNVITVTKTDGTSSTFRVKNGAQGEKGDKGDPGAAGADGKSAYQYAKDGGYTGTETEFADKLAEDTATKAYVDGKRFTATATLLASGWGKSGGGYGYTLTIAGVKSADYPHITPIYAGIADISLSKQQMDAWANVSAAAAGDGKIWFTCYEEKPTVNIKIQIEVMR